MNIEKEDLAWLAGLLEGEGSFMLGRNIVNERLYHYPKIVVAMTDEDVIARAAGLFGTSVYVIPPTEGRKQQWRAQKNGSGAAEIMVALLPHMGIRRSAKIEEILEEYGEIEPTEVRRARSCSIAQKRRWAMYGTKTGRLPSADYRENE